MKSKATSFGIAALMVLMAFCCVSVTDEVDASSYTTLTGMHFDPNDEVNYRLFTVNEGEFYGYAYTLSIGVTNADGPNPSDYNILYKKDVPADGEKDILIDVDTDIKNSTVEIDEDDNNLGSYDIKISRANEEDFSYTLGIKVDMIITVGSVVVEMDPIYLKMSVTTSASDDIIPSFKTMEFEVGKYDAIKIEENYPSVLGSIDLYHWYAEDLPKGLSMSENGFVSGIAESAKTATAKVYIFGHEGNGEYTAELTIHIKAATNNPNSFDYTIKKGDDESKNCYDYVAVEGDVLKLTLTAKQPSYFTVDSVDQLGNYSSTIVEMNDNNTVGECTLTTKGTGCYKVNIMCKNLDDSGQETKFFHIYVIPAFNVVKAQMTIASS